MSEMNYNGWRFDVPTGVYFNDELSGDVLYRAEKLAGHQALQIKLKSNETVVRVKETKDGFKLTHNRQGEYGCSFRLPIDDDKLEVLVQHLAALLKKIDVWIVLPHLRRADDSYYQCSCGAQFPIPHDFGRNDYGFADHKGLFPKHTHVFVTRLSELIAFYGIGMGPVQPTRDCLSLIEGGAIPEKIIS